MTIACPPRSRRPGWIASGRGRRTQSAIKRFDPCYTTCSTASASWSSSRSSSSRDSLSSASTRRVGSSVSSYNDSEGSDTTHSEDDDEEEYADYDVPSRSRRPTRPLTRGAHARSTRRLRSGRSRDSRGHAASYIYRMRMRDDSGEYKLGVSRCPEARAKAAFTFRSTIPVICARVAVPPRLGRYACESAVIAATRRHRNVTFAKAGREVFETDEPLASVVRRFRRHCQRAFASVDKL